MAIFGFSAALVVEYRAYRYQYMSMLDQRHWCAPQPFSNVKCRQNVDRKSNNSVALFADGGFSVTREMKLVGELETNCRLHERQRRRHNTQRRNNVDPHERRSSTDAEGSSVTHALVARISDDC